MFSIQVTLDYFTLRAAQLVKAHTIRLFEPYELLLMISLLSLVFKTLLLVQGVLGALLKEWTCRSNECMASAQAMTLPIRRSRSDNVYLKLRTALDTATLARDLPEKTAMLPGAFRPLNFVKLLRQRARNLVVLPDCIDFADSLCKLRRNNGVGELFFIENQDLADRPRAFFELNSERNDFLDNDGRARNR